MSSQPPQPTPDIARHEPALLLLARCQLPGCLRGILDPEDLVQETVREVLGAPDRFAGMTDDQMLLYLMRSLKNNLIDALRRDANRGRVSQQVVEDSSRRLDDWIDPEHTSPSERAVRNEQFARLAVALAALPEAQRLAVEMRYLRKMDVTEMARELDRTPNAVSQLIHRGLTALNRAMTEPDA